MEEKLPEYADVVVLGTGLPEALLAAACGRAGLSVLHLDRNQYYGGDWSSFTMSMIHEAAENKNCKLSADEVSNISTTFLKNNEKLVELGDRKVVDDMDIKWIPRELDEKPMQEKLKELGQMRKFSIDLLPKMLLSKGDMVRTLCDSQVSMYAEFKLVDRQLCPSECQDTKKILLNPVPVSKGEIFQSDALTMLEKRNLMKFITFCTLWNGKTQSERHIVMDGTADRPFAEFLEMMGVSRKLQEFIIHTIGILDSQPTTASGMKACCEFMNSVGCYGPSPFLFPIYGCGELSQCFCRLAAVFGSLYCLGRPIQALVEENGKIVAVIADNQRINCRHVIMSSRYVPEDIPVQSSQKFDRIIYATDKPLKKHEKEAVTLVNLAAFRPDSEVSRVVETGGYISTAPNGHYLVHATGTQEGSSNVESLVDRLFEENEISPYWKMSFTMNSMKFDSSQMGGVNNIVVAPPVDPNIHYANVIDECREIFMNTWPDLDFLPRAMKEEEEEEELQRLEQEVKGIE